VVTKKMKQHALWPGRVISWFSCGAASAVASKLAHDARPDTLSIYHDLHESEHPDNQRFLADVERWIGTQILRTRHPAYGGNVNAVFEAMRFLRGPHGAPCTHKLKRDMGRLIADFNDTNVFGFTADEGRRIADFERRQPDVKCWWILRDAGLDKAACLKIVQDAGIALPAMYALGFEHNNCRACVKSRSPKYWNLTRRHFPDDFKRRAEQERQLAFQIIRGTWLDELPPDDTSGTDEHIECGTFCQVENQNPLEFRGDLRI
jgi:hypothetical protein